MAAGVAERSITGETSEPSQLMYSAAGIVVGVLPTHVQFAESEANLAKPLANVVDWIRSPFGVKAPRGAVVPKCQTLPLAPLNVQGPEGLFPRIPRSKSSDHTTTPVPRRAASSLGLVSGRTSVVRATRGSAGFTAYCAWAPVTIKVAKSKMYLWFMCWVFRFFRSAKVRGPCR